MAGNQARGRHGTPASVLGGGSLLEQALTTVRSIEPSSQVILYGSRARGDAEPDSDWDLLILFDGPDDPNRQDAIRRRIYALELDSGECISAIVHGRDAWDSPRSRVMPFYAHVQDDGIDLATMQPAPRGDPERFTEAEMAEARREAVDEWLGRARDALRLAHLAAEAGLRNECVSRLYYACFDAVRALLLQRGYRFSRHSNVQSLFNQHFVHIGLVPPDLGDLYNELFKQRGRADYEAFARFDEATVRPWITDAERFIAHIQGLLEP
jgi:uncharacterized protein (UPF0332 family)